MIERGQPKISLPTLSAQRALNRCNKAGQGIDGRANVGGHKLLRICARRIFFHAEVKSPIVLFAHCATRRGTAQFVSITGYVNERATGGDGLTWHHYHEPLINIGFAQRHEHVPPVAFSQPRKQQVRDEGQRQLCIRACALAKSIHDVHMCVARALGLNLS